MRNKKSWSVVAMVAASLALGGCHHHRGAHNESGDMDGEQDEHAEPDLGSGISTGFAVNAIATARCEREQRCENVGQDKTYESMGACEEKIHHDWADDLNKYECPHGIHKAELDQCLTAVRAEDCLNPFDSLTRIAQCTTADICDD